MLFSVKTTSSSNVSGILTPIPMPPGALDVKTKELPGLVVRLRRMLRGDDCIKYHLGKSYEPGITPGSYMKYLLWPISLVAPLLFRYEKGGRIRGGITGN